MSKIHVALAWITETTIRIGLGVGIIIANDPDILPPFVRYKSVQTWQDCNFPHKEEGTIPYMAVVVSAIIIPFFIVSIVSIVSSMCTSAWERKQSKSKRAAAEFGTGVLALTMSLLVTELITDLMKVWVGRHRPDFLSRCFTPPSMRTDENWLTLPSRQTPEWALTELQRQALRDFGRRNGSESYQNEVFFPYIEDVPSYLTTAMCYPDGKVDSARKSFPSGHTSMAFAGSTFIALLCYHWLIKWQFSFGFEKFRIPGPSIAIAMFFLSYVPAFFTAISRTQDYRHFAADVIAGGILGTTVTYLCFIQYYKTNLFNPDGYRKAKSIPSNG